ncbi:malate dehydrogenase (quinone) [Vibrio olivae]|uniref:Probable malate:quinone oxidoreductase n=1 Tax=Vibrio olivae TaxID=1243002 RepID=A0ABV5HJC3_9VIBR
MKKVSGQNGFNQPNEKRESELVDVVLIGGGIMSATLGTFIQQLEPSWRIEMFERLDDVAQESSNGWNNAGTGHSSLAESNYTPETADGEVKFGKAVDIYEQFQLSRQFWAYLVDSGLIQDPSTFINSVPHMSFVAGEKNVNFLRKRFELLNSKPLFKGMVYSEDREQLKSWAPLLMEGRDPKQPVAATRSRFGTDVNFGALTRQLINILSSNRYFSLHLQHEVRSLKQRSDGTWQMTVTDLTRHTERNVVAKYVFIGAGGASLTLLQKSGIPEAKSYGGFPVGGQFLVTENPNIVKAHQAKVYGKAPVGAPPMSVPHMDTRIIDGKEVLLFGPFASFSSKFLKQGSLLDLFASVSPSNFLPMTQVGLKSFDLIKYLVGQLLQSNDDRMKALREFYPQANPDDWTLLQAGQRVQIIKNIPERGGELHLGSELVHASDGSLSALLGASPGASVSASIMLNLLERCFTEQMASVQWQQKIKQMIPSYGKSLDENPDLNLEILLATSRTLQLSQDLVEVRRSEIPPAEEITVVGAN